MTRNRLIKDRLWPYATAAIGWLLLCYGVFLFILDESQAFELTREDSLYEVVSAGIFLLTAIVFFATFIKNKKRSLLANKGNLIFLLLGLLFLFGFCEEISWGQRLFNITTPEVLQTANRQGEINIHNLSIFHARHADGTRKSGLALLLSAERLFSLFWLTFCVLVPLSFKLHQPTQRTLKALRFPIVPLSLGTLFALNYVASKLISQQLILQLKDPLIEVKECGFAFLFLVVALWFMTHYTLRVPQQRGMTANRGSS